MRDLTEVREEILAAIPDEKIREELKTATEAIMRSALYEAPERQWVCWGRLGDVLFSMLGDPNQGPDWKKEVQRIMAGKPKPGKKM